MTASTPTDPAPDSTGTPRSGESAGEAIDRYRLIEEIGEGGMGTVWRAEQSEPVRRDVALKIIKLGMDTREVIGRFEAERQALALMDHPCIAKVFDGGATAGGRPYFVMELVQGVPITEYCDRERLGLRARLELFARTCEAIQHAHQKGLIHRDIKPSNVLVGEQDGEPAPKVIDFGIAKATGTELAQQTMFTQVGQVIGTPDYMAPEQAEGSGADVDTRADVYSLGVLLYELLTGTRPFDLRTILESGYDELLRTIREVDPAKPSTRVSTLGKAAAGIATNRREETRDLSRRLRGDLDWIVMKALEKDRARRYDTANGFALDVRRFLEDEPVVAAPPGAGYRLRKLVRRRKKTVAAVAAIAFLLVAGTVGTGIGLWRTVRANRALDLALEEKGAALKEEEHQRELADANAGRARSAEAEAQARAAELEQVAAFQATQLGEIDPELMGVRLRRSLHQAMLPERRVGFETSVAGVNFTSIALRALEENLFDRTIAAIDAQFSDQPLVRADLLQVVAETTLALGLVDVATGPQERALAILRETLGDADPRTVYSINAHGQLLQARGEFAAAEPLLREALETRRRDLGEDHEDTLDSISNVGTLLRDSGRLDEAEPLYREALEGMRRLHGDEDTTTLLAVSNLGLLLHDLGRLNEAEPYHRESVEGLRRVLGDEHPDTLSSISNLGFLLKDTGRFPEAERYTREALEGRRRVLGDEHGDTLISLVNLGAILHDQRRLDEAEPCYRQALEGFRTTLGEDHVNTLGALNNVASVLNDQGRPTEALPFYREAAEATHRVLGPLHPGTLIATYGLGRQLQTQGDPEEARPHLIAAARGFREVLGPGHANTRTATRELGQLLTELVAAARQDRDDARLGEALAHLGAYHVELDAHVAAEVALGEALDVLYGILDEDDPLLWRTQARLGLVIAVQGRHAEAEPLIVESAERTLGTPDPEPVERVIAFYDDWHATSPGQGHDARADAWRERRERRER